MKKQLTLKKVTLFVLSALLLVLMAISVAFSAGTRAFAADSGAGSSASAETDHSGHVLGEMSTVKPATCVEPGVGSFYCETCNRSFNVVIPADVRFHNLEEKTEGVYECTICGAKGANAVLAPVESKNNDADNVYVQAVESDVVTELDIPAVMEHEGKEKKVHLADNAFANNNVLTTVTIDSAVDIGENAFKGCSELETVKIVQKEEGGEITTYVAADAFDKTKFYEENLNGEGGVQSLSIPIVRDASDDPDKNPEKVVGTYLLKVVVPNATGSEGGGAKSRAHRRDAAEAPKLTSFTVPANTLVIASGAFEGLADLTTVTLNPELHTVCADAFKGTGLANVFIAAAGEEIPTNSFVSVEGLSGISDIYYKGSYEEGIFTRLLDVIRYYSAAEPSNKDHPYWHFSGGETGLPVIWSPASKLYIDASKCNRFMLNTAFSSEGLIVYVGYEDGTSRLVTDINEYHVDEDHFKDKFNISVEGTYDIYVSYKDYGDAVSTTYRVVVSNAYRVTTKYENGTDAKEEHFWARDASGKDATFTFPTEQEQPTYEGHKFAGWKVEGDESDTVYSSGQAYGTLTKDITIVAQWETLYTVTVNCDEHVTAQIIQGTPTDDGVAGNVDYYAKGAQITFTLTVANGYKLSKVEGAEPNDDGTYSVTVGTENVTVSVTTAAVVVTKTFALGGGTGAEFAEPQYNEAKDQVTLRVATNPTKDGYRFDGWDVKVDDVALTDDDEDGLYTLDLKNTDVNVTFTAKWEKMSITRAYSATLTENSGVIKLDIYVQVQNIDENTIQNVALKVGDTYLSVDGTPTKGDVYFKLTYNITELTTLNSYALDLVYGESHVDLLDGTIDGASKVDANLRYQIADGKLNILPKYTVTFVAENATAPADVTVYGDDEYDFTKIEPQVSEGYAFLYWYYMNGETETKLQKVAVSSIAAKGVYTVTVTAKIVELYTVSTNITDYAELHFWNDGALYNSVKLDNNITVTLTNPEGTNVTNTGKYDSLKGEWRAYSSENVSINFIADEDVTICSIKITFNPKNNGKLTYDSKVLTTSNNAVEVTNVNKNTAAFSVTGESKDGKGQARITAIEVVYYGGKVLDDQGKADAVIDDIKVFMDAIIAKTGTLIFQEINLPRSTMDGVTLEWTVTDSSVARVEDNVLILTRAEGSDKPFTLGVIARCNGASSSVTEDEGWHFTVKGLPAQGTEFNGKVFDPVATYGENNHPLKGETEIVGDVSYAFGGNGTQIQYYPQKNKDPAAIRAYGGNTITISVPEGYKITKITLSFASGEKDNTITADVGEFNVDTWTGLANSVTLEISGTSGHRRINKFVVDYVYGQPAGPSDEEITEEAWESAEAEGFLAKTVYTETGSYDLPEKHENGAKYSWSFRGEVDDTCVSLDGNHLVISKLPSTDLTVTLLLTISYGESTLDEICSYEITIKAEVVTHTLAVTGDTENVEIAFEREYEGYDDSTYVEGESVIVTITAKPGFKVTNILIEGVEEGDNGWQNYDEGEYWITMTADVTITIKTEEIPITYKVSLKAGTEYVEIGNFKVDGETNNGPYNNGTTVTFTLTITNMLYTITSVKNGTQELTAQDGRYSVTISGADVEITVTTDYNYGAKTNPLSIEQAIALGTAQCGTKEETWTKQMVFVRGVVAEAPTISGSQYKQFYLGNSKADDTTKLLVWATELEDKVDAPEQNDTVIIHGYIEYYQSRLELTGHSGSGKAYPTIVFNDRGTSTIEVTNDGGATIDPQIPSSQTNGQEITFKVTVSEEGKKAVVTVNGETIQADGEGNYKFTVHGDMTVDIKVVDASAATETKQLFSLTFGSGYSSSDGSHTGYNNNEWTAKRGDHTWAIVNFNNNGYQNDWTYIKAGYDRQAVTASITSDKINEVITSITVKLTALASASVDAYHVIVSKSDTFSSTDIVQEFKETMKVGDNKFTMANPGAGYYYKVAFDCKKAKAVVTLSEISYSGYEAAPTPGGGGTEGGGDTGGGTTEPGGGGQVAELTFGKSVNSEGTGGYENNWSVTKDGKTYGITNCHNNNNGWNYVKTCQGTSTITTNFAFTEKISKIVVTIDAFTANSVTSFKLERSTKSDFSQDLTTISLDMETGENTFAITDPTANCYYRISIVGTANKCSTISKVVFYAVASSDVGMEGPSATDLVANVNSEIPSGGSLWLYVLGGSALLVSVISLSALAFVLIRKKHN